MKAYTKLSALTLAIRQVERLTILTALYPVEKMEYVRLLKVWKFGQSTLSKHLRRLEIAGYVKLERTFRGKYPQTWCILTKRGRNEIHRYAQQLKPEEEK